MSSTTSTATPPRHGFEQSVDEVKVSKNDLNKVIMEYLIKEGYPAAAQKFATEANMPYKPNCEAIQARVAIREAIYSGRIQSAIEMINELAPQILDENRLLHFALLRLQLIEMIRENLSTDPPGDPNPIFDFASANLSPQAHMHEQTLRDLEHTMSLMFFPGPKPPEIAYQFEPKIKQDTAKRVNEALLRAHNQKTYTTLTELVDHRAWSHQKALDVKRIGFEDHLSLGLDPMPQNAHNSGHNGTSQHNGSGSGDAMATNWDAE